MNEDTRTDELARLVADIYEVAGALRASGDRLAGQVGQTQARWQVLSVISEGDWTVPAIASRLGVTRQAVQRIADDLVEAGAVRYGDNPSHRRSPLVRPTDAGMKALEAITASSERWRAQVAETLSPDDIVHVRETLRTLLAAIRNTPVEPSTGSRP